jgi:hypothetical protein
MAQSEEFRRAVVVVTGFHERHGPAEHTQAQLSHADPRITLKHYQQAIPETVRQ